MRPYGSTMLSTRAGKFSISSESNGLVTQPEGHGDEGGGESWRSLSIDLHNALSLQALQVTDTGCRLFPVVGLLFLQFPGQMTYPVASLTLDSARSYVMQGAPFTKRSISSIPIGGSISPEGFLPSILLMVFMVTVVIVAVY
ncbi:hypothetical protein Tco_0518125 [Tanacetum coccineum]